MPRTLRTHHWMTAITAISIALASAACSPSDSTAPDASDGGAGAGLSGGMNEKRGSIRGNIGLGGGTVELLTSTGEVCDEGTPALQTTTSGNDGSFEFTDLDTSMSYCVGHDGSTATCACDWTQESCDCSPSQAP